MEFVYHDGGRKDAGYKGTTGDCVCRAVSIATQRPYIEAYEALSDAGRAERLTKRKRKRSHARTGMRKATIRKFLTDLGWTWTPTMHIGKGCTVHLRASELPPGRVIVQVSKHLTCVINGVLHDTHDCSRDGTRCVYGYWTQEG